MNLPNKLTLLRVILVPVFMVFAAFGRIGTSDYNPTAQLVAGIIFSWTATWPAKTTWSPTSASSWTPWPTRC